VGGYYHHTLVEQYTAPLSISSAIRMSNGTFRISGQALPNSTIDIQTSSNLLAPFQLPFVSRTVDGNGSFQYDDTSPGTRKSYRAAYP
jgi:hypothetical protein